MLLRPARFHGPYKHGKEWGYAEAGDTTNVTRSEFFKGGGGTALELFRRMGLRPANVKDPSRKRNVSKAAHTVKTICPQMVCM